MISKNKLVEFLAEECHSLCMDDADDRNTMALLLDKFLEPMTFCEDCSGEGFQDYGPLCNGSCDWCGGCYGSEPCHTCDATGEVEKE